MKKVVFSLICSILVTISFADCAKYTKKQIQIDSKLQAVKVNNTFSGQACVASDNLILYRGDSRATSEIFKDGFKLKETSKQALANIKMESEWKDMLGVGSGGFTDNGISTALSENTAKTYTTNCTYIIDSKGLTPISVEATVNHYENKSNDLGDEILFIKDIPNTRIIGCKPKNGSSVIKNPSYNGNFK